MSSDPSTSLPPVHPFVAWRVLRAMLKDAEQLEYTLVDGDKRRREGHIIVQLADDHREIDADAFYEPDSETACFIAVAGSAADGHAYIEPAIANGARVIVCEKIPDGASKQHPKVTFAKVTDSRRARALLATDAYDHPSRHMNLVGVTGTNGKTTVTYLVHHALNALGTDAGLISTIDVRSGQASQASRLTTPGPIELNRTLAEMGDHGQTACAMEVSSHALDQGRVLGIHYDVAVFTNLTRDHLNYHGSFETYRAAKKKLFDALDDDAIAVVNADDAAGAAMVADTAARCWTYGTADDADVRFEVVESRTDGLRLRMDLSNAPMGVTVDSDTIHDVRLAGRFNAYNLAAAFATVCSFGYDGAEVLRVLSDAPPVPGRFETLTFDDGTTVVVDYAHTPDALENILNAVRETATEGARLWCVFGCGGDRDATKRRIMGSLAETLADRVVVTSDNPRTEDPETIMNEIRRGMSRPADAEWIVDRDAAIRFVAENAAPGDVVLIAGKGHETYQIIGTTRRDFDDRDKARTYFERRLNAASSR